MNDTAPREMSRYSATYEQYILVIDNQRKASFASRDAAVAAGEKVVEGYPLVRVIVTDRDTNEDLRLSR